MDKDRYWVTTADFCILCSANTAINSINDMFNGKTRFYCTANNGDAVVALLEKKSNRWCWVRGAWYVKELKCVSFDIATTKRMEIVRKPREEMEIVHETWNERWVTIGR